jgi:hypothetical protein
MVSGPLYTLELIVDMDPGNATNIRIYVTCME